MKTIAYVVNNYSSTGMVQIRRFGEDDGVSDISSLKWAYIDQGSDSMGVAGVGKTHSLKPGCRVHVGVHGGKEGSFIVTGSFGRMGSGSSTDSSQPDSTTSVSDVDCAKSDFCIPVKDPNAPNGTRAEAKAPDGRYNKQAGGSPLDMSDNQYPQTIFKSE
jgi:hypothetical protein